LIKNIYDLETTFTKNRINELAELLDVSKLLDTQMRNLSLGERMKMELIGSILHNPEVLFLDEPTIGLDILTKKRVRTFLREIQQRDKITLILTSHDIDDIEAVCDRVIIINKGEKCFDDSIETLIAKYHQNRYLRFVLETALSKEQIEQIKQWGVLEKNNKNNDNTYLFKTNTEKMIPLVTSLLSENKVLDMQIESVPLEDVVADLFKAS
jgi:ABC-2 type transport system ATP-binding protein